MRMTFGTALGLGFLLCLTACHKKVALKTAPPPASPPRSILALEEGDRNFADRNWAIAISRYDEYLSLSGSREHTDHVLFQEAVIYSQPDYSEHNSERSFSLFKQLIAQYPSSTLKPAAELMVKLHDEKELLSTQRDDGYKQLEKLREELQKAQQTPVKSPVEEAAQALASGDCLKIISTFEDYLHISPTGEQSELALFELGLNYGLPSCTKRNADRSNTYLKQLVTQHPASPYTTPAQTILTLREQIAVLTTETDKRDQKIKQLNSELDRLKVIDAQRPRRP